FSCRFCWQGPSRRTHEFSCGHTTGMASPGLSYAEDVRRKQRRGFLKSDYLQQSNHTKQPSIKRKRSIPHSPAECSHEKSRGEVTISPHPRNTRKMGDKLNSH